MVHALQDRPVRTTAAPVPAPRRRRVALRLAGVGLLAVVGVAGVDRLVGALPSLSNPLAEQTVDRERPALLLALSDLSEYSAAEASLQVVVDLEKDTPLLPGFVKGERTTYLAVGSVEGVVDFRGLGEGAVQVEGDAVTIVLPRPRLGEAQLDLGDSRVVARDRGVVDRVAGAFSDSPTSEREVALLAERKLRAAAAESDVLARAEANTRDMLIGLARSLGFTDVTVSFDADIVA